MVPILVKFDTVPGALTLRFLRNFRKLTAKNTSKLENYPLHYDFSRKNVTAKFLPKFLNLIFQIFFEIKCKNQIRSKGYDNRRRKRRSMDLEVNIRYVKKLKMYSQVVQ